MELGDLHTLRSRSGMMLENIWKEQIVDKYSDFIVITLGTFIVHELIWFSLNFFYICLDEFDLCQQYKIHKDRKVPSEVRWNAFKRLLKGHFLELLPVTMIGYPILRFFGFQSGLPLPSLETFLFQFLVFNIIEDTGFYWVHLWMHTPWAYKKFHYVHHEYTTPFSLTGEIAHPVEFILNFLLPLMAGPVILGYFQGCHIITFWIWMFFRGLRSTDSHSGYNLPFHPLRLISFIYSGPLGHDFHHQTYGRNSQFGGYKVWDWLMGTDRKYKDYLSKQQ